MLLFFFYICGNQESDTCQCQGIAKVMCWRLFAFCLLMGANAANGCEASMVGCCPIDCHTHQASLPPHTSSDKATCVMLSSVNKKTRECYFSVRSFTGPHAPLKSTSSMLTLSGHEIFYAAMTISICLASQGKQWKKVKD